MEQCGNGRIRHRANGEAEGRRAAKCEADLVYPFLDGVDKLIMNLLYTYCRCGTEQALSDDTMGGLIQGLRHVYSEAGHRGAWVVDKKNQTAPGGCRQLVS